jgi:hypothetical protein
VIWDIDNSLHFNRWLSENKTDPDFTHYRFTFRATHQNGPHEVPTRVERVARFLHRQLGKSVLLWTGYQGLESLRHRQSGREQVVFPNGETIFLSLREQEHLAQGIDRPQVADMREILFRPLERLKTEVEEQGGRFVVVLMPSKEELYGADDFPTILRPIQEVRAGLESRGLPVLDLYPVFRELGRERSPFYRADPHPNAFGHQIVADALAKWITEQSVFPAPATAVAGASADR